MTKAPKLTQADLSQFTGSENWYRHALNRNVLYTDGAKYIADQGGAYWLLDAIAISQLCDRRVGAEPFQVWRLLVLPNRTAKLTCEDGDYKIVHAQNLSFTDFPIPGVTLWFANNTIYLPSEH
jgi:hypothetical protein